MTAATFASYVRSITKSNSTTFPDATLLLFMNIWKDEIAGEIVDKVDEDYFGAPQTTDMVNGQREYPLPIDLPGKLKKIEAVLDPTFLDSNGNPIWVALRQFDLSQYDQLSRNIVTGDATDNQYGVQPTTDEDTIQSLFGNRQGEAAYMLYRNSIWIFSGALQNFIGGNNYLKLWGYEWPADITDLSSTAPLENDPTSTSAGIPRQIHKVWADRVILSFEETADREYQPTDYESELDSVLDDRIMSLTQVDKDESYTATRPRVYNDGYDL